MDFISKFHYIVNTTDMSYYYTRIVFVKTKGKFTVFISYIGLPQLLAEESARQRVLYAYLLNCLDRSSPGFALRVFRRLVGGEFGLSDESFKFMKKVFVWKRRNIFK